MKIRWTVPALNAVEEIGDFIARDNRAAAARTVATIFQQTDLLAGHPAIGRAGRTPQTRELVISGTPYIVPYRVHNEEVQILAVFHGARKWPEKFD